MTNPTLLVSTFDESLAYTTPSGDGVWTGVDPIRYDGGLWVEGSTTNIQPNPTAETNLDGWLTTPNDTNATLARTTSDAIAPFAFSITANSSGTAGMRAGIGALFAASAGDVMTVSVACRSDDITAMTIQVVWLDGGFSDLTNETSSSLTVSAIADRVAFTFAAAPAMTGFGQLFFRMVGNDTNDVLYLARIQTEEKAYATSYADDVLGDGYGGTDGAYTRAASSAAITIAEPVGVACWYREEYSGAQQFAYLSPLGTLGDYGDISWSGGDLTISTSRNLVIGPFAAFDRELTAIEQSNLNRTQSWNLSTVLGGNRYTNFQLRPY